MAEVEERWGDAEFLSPAWFASWGIAGIDIVNNVNKARHDVGNAMMKASEDFGQSIVQQYMHWPVGSEADGVSNPLNTRPMSEW